MAAIAEVTPETDGVDVEALTHPFDEGEVKQRTGLNNCTVRYVSGSAVIDRLLSATGSAFSWKVEKVELVTQDTSEGPVSYWVVLGSLAVKGMGSRGRNRHASR